MLQQIIVRPRPEEPVTEMFRNWSKSERGDEVGSSVVDRASETLVGHVTLFGANLPVRAATLAVMIGGEHEEGVHREATCHDGHFNDEVMMSALARDWPPVK